MRINEIISMGHGSVSSMKNYIIKSLQLLNLINEHVENKTNRDNHVLLKE